MNSKALLITCTLFLTACGSKSHTSMTSPPCIPPTNGKYCYQNGKPEIASVLNYCFKTGKINTNAQLKKCVDEAYKPVKLKYTTTKEVQTLK